MALSPDEHCLIYEPDHRARSLELMLWQDLDRPRLRALVEALAHGAQLLEDQIWALISGRVLDTAFGAALDQWGALVGVTRGGLSDDAYRSMIEVQVYANTCLGSTDDLIHIAQLACAPCTVRHTTRYPGAGRLEIYRASFMSEARAARVARLLLSVVPAGVGLEVLEGVPGRDGWSEDWAAADTDPSGVACRSLLNIT
jgi:hypothetical protein